MKVFVLDNGYLECDSNHMVAMETCATVANKSPTHNWIKIPVYAVLIDHPEAKILFDTGCPANAMKGYWPEYLTSLFPYFHSEDQRFEKQLQKAGVTAKDIDIVVLSHMHLDHAGNLGLFTHADVYVHRDDFTFGLRSTHTNPDRITHGAYIREDLQVPCKFKLVEDDFELLPGLDVVTLPGHTPGVLGIVVKLDQSGTLIFPADAIYQCANFGPPARLSGIVYDSVAFLSSIEKARKLVKKHNAQLMYSHEMDFFNTMKKAPEFYS